MHILSPSDVKNATVAEIRRWIPTVAIARPPIQQPDGTWRPQPPNVHRLNVYTETGEIDAVTGIAHGTKDNRHFPFIYVYQIDRHTIQRQREGDYVRYFYQYLIGLFYHINIDPQNREVVARLNEALEWMELTLERVLSSIAMPWGDIVATQNRHAGDTSDGILRFYFNVEVSELQMPDEYDKVKSWDLGVKLIGDELS